MRDEQWWFIAFYIVLPTVILEAIFKFVEIFVYHPPTWLSIAAPAVIPLLAFPFMYAVMWTIGWICLIAMDTRYIAKQAIQSVRAAVRWLFARRESTSGN